MDIHPHGSKKVNVIARSLAKADVNVAINSGTKIKDVIDIKPKNTSATSDMSVVYEIPCNGCEKSYVGETGRGVKVRLKEHKSDVRFHRTSNAIVMHIDQCNHLPDWEGTRILEKNIKSKPENY